MTIRAASDEKNDDDKKNNDDLMTLENDGGNNNSNNNTNEFDDDDDYNNDNMISLIILDPLQSRFEVRADPSWTISKFKSRGERVHKVPPTAQRLIYRGRMLQDSTTIKDSGITETETIIHLFPKPRVVVLNNNDNNNVSSNNNTDTNNNDNNGNDDGNNENNNGAHIPQIIIDADEQQRRTSILVLGSSHALGATNNVKLVSLLLLLVSAIELLNLFGILMSAALQTQHQQMPVITMSPSSSPPPLPQLNITELNTTFESTTSNSSNIFSLKTQTTPPDGIMGTAEPSSFSYESKTQTTPPDGIMGTVEPTSFFYDDDTISIYSDDYATTTEATAGAVYRANNHKTNNDFTAHWQIHHNFFLMIAFLGLYVATLGIQATHENTTRLSKRYMYGTFLVGISWMVYNGIRYAKQLSQDYEKKQEQQQAINGNDDYSSDEKFSNTTYYDGTSSRPSSDDSPTNNDSFTEIDNRIIYFQTSIIMILSAVIWFFCCLRAWQFHRLLSEAEREAEERILNIAFNTNNDNNNNSSAINSQNRNNNNTDNDANNNNNDVEQGNDSNNSNPVSLTTSGYYNVQ